MTLRPISLLLQFGLVILLLVGTLSLLKLVQPLFAQDAAVNQKQQEIADLQAKLTEIRGQKQTLAQTISYINTKIQLTQKQVENTQAEIVVLEDEVQALSGKIVILDSNLDQLTALLINRIQTTYIKAITTKPVYLLLTSNGLGDFLKRYKYLRVGQKHEQQIMKQWEADRTNLSEQKNTKEIKQTELEKAKKRLISQKTALNQQQVEKQSLLQVTRNDEVKYQALLATARRELSAMQHYVQSQGGASLLANQTKCNDWGCYYNQRDSQWGNMLIGDSDMTMAEVGCLITSTAMVATHYGKSLKPSDIAANSSVFFGGTAYMNQGCWSTNGVSVCRTRVSPPGDVKAAINAELNDNHPVIVELYGGSTQHFIVIKGRDGDNYIMNDPYLENGGDRPFSDKYTIGNIVSVDKVRVN